MKKKFSVFILVVLNTFLFAYDNSFIKIDSVKTVIGNDYFKAMQKAFTGVAGEVNEVKMKYYRKEHDVELSDYAIKKYLITYLEFQLFLEDSNYRTLYERDKGSSYMKQLEMPDLPVKRISFIDAVAYCQWYSDKTGKNYRLPTSAEWEYAALAGEKKIFPWGNEAKILLSTKTDSIVGRENLPVYQVTEDMSSLGMCNLMGGEEYTLDCYDEGFYEKSPYTNPVCLIPYNASCLMRGIDNYNLLENDVFGLYDYVWNEFGDYGGYSYFRIVEADNTVFNKNTIDEAYYCTKLAKASIVSLLKHPRESEEKIIYEPISNLYILFRSKDEQFYRCSFQVYEKDVGMSTFSKIWKTGWVNKDEIEILKKKWYNKQ